MDLVDFIKKNKIMVIAVCVIIFLLILNNYNDKREHMTGDDSNITITGTADDGTIEGTLSNTNADGATTETTITGNISGTITSGTITGIITDGNISGTIVNNDVTNTISGTITDNTITVVSAEDISSGPSVGTCHKTSLESPLETSLKAQMAKLPIWNSHDDAIEDSMVMLKDITTENQGLFSQVDIIKKKSNGSSLFIKPELDDTEEQMSIPNTILKDENGDIIFEELSIQDTSERGYLTSKIVDPVTNAEVDVFMTRLNLDDCSMNTSTNLGNNDCTGDLPILLTKQLLLMLPSRDEISQFSFTRLLDDTTVSNDKTRYQINSSGVGTGQGTLSLKNKFRNDVNVFCFQHPREACSTYVEGSAKRAYCNTQYSMELEHTLFGFRIKFRKNYYKIIPAVVELVNGKAVVTIAETYAVDENNNPIIEKTETFYATIPSVNPGAKCKINNRGQYRLGMTKILSEALVFRFVKFNKKYYKNCVKKCQEVFPNGHNAYKTQVINQIMPVITNELTPNVIADRFFSLPLSTREKYLDQLNSTVAEIDAASTAPTPASAPTPAPAPAGNEE